MSGPREPASPGALRSLLSRLAAPADDWARPEGGGRRGALVLLMAALAGILVLVGIGAVLQHRAGGDGLLLAAMLALLALAACIVGVLVIQVDRYLLRPLAQLYEWALAMCDGNLSARIPTPQRGRFAKLTFHINRLSEALDRLANEMDDTVLEQTERLRQKNQSLETLYEVTAAITETDALREVLETSVRKLMRVVGAAAGSVRVRADGGEMQELLRIDGGGPAGGPPLAEGELRRLELAAERRCDGSPGPMDAADLPGSRWSHLLVPLHYQGRTRGVVHLYSPEGELGAGEETGKLLASIGRHLGMAVAKSRLDEEARNLGLMRERASLAHELHDSLAQTLASLRFQVRMLEDTMRGAGASAAVRGELDRLRERIDAAHTELRELVANFRAPMDERGLLPALESLVARFRRESGIATYFQTECPVMRLSAASEMQVLGIVREALNNVRKHSGARTVRILLRCEDGDRFVLLVEDDGVGVGDAPCPAGRPGEHVGLAIMEERAKRLGAELRIESEPGDGTRVELSFAQAPADPPARARAS